MEVTKTRKKRKRNKNKSLRQKLKMQKRLLMQTLMMRKPRELRKHMVASKMNLRDRHATNRKPRSVRRSLMRPWMKSSNWGQLMSFRAPNS